MTARAEGFWWVRTTAEFSEGAWARIFGPWLCRWVSGDAVLDGPHGEWWGDLGFESYEWGPYLGKEPGDTDIRQRLDAIEEQLARIPVPEVSPMAFKLDEGGS